MSEWQGWKIFGFPVMMSLIRGDSVKFLMCNKMTVPNTLFAPETGGCE